MEVQLTPDQEAFVRQAIQTGRLRREEEAVKEALALWEERERTRAEVPAAVDEAEASLGRGEGRVITEQSARELAAEVKQRGYRLAEKQTHDCQCRQPFSGPTVRDSFYGRSHPSWRWHIRSR